MPSSKVDQVDHGTRRRKQVNILSLDSSEGLYHSSTPHRKPTLDVGERVIMEFISESKRVVEYIFSGSKRSTKSLFKHSLKCLRT